MKLLFINPVNGANVFFAPPTPVANALLPFSTPSIDAPKSFMIEIYPLNLLGVKADTNPPIAFVGLNLPKIVPIDLNGRFLKKL